MVARGEVRNERNPGTFIPKSNRPEETAEGGEFAASRRTTNGFYRPCRGSFVRGTKSPGLRSFLAPSRATFELLLPEQIQFLFNRNLYAKFLAGLVRKVADYFERRFRMFFVI